MSIQIKGLVCPQCGATGSSKVTGTPNLYACKNCQAEFVLSDSNAPKSVHVVHSMAHDQFEKLRKFKLGLAVGAGVFMVLLLTPFLLDRFKKAGPPPEQPGRLEASTVYVPEGGKTGFVRVLETGDDRSDRYRIVITDLASGKSLAEPQTIDFQRNTGSRRPAIKHFSDGSIYLVLNAQRLMRLEPAGPRFVDMNEALINRYPQQLGVGVAKLELAISAYPDLLKVTTNSGENYNVYWLTGEILREGESYDDLRKRPYASYTDTVKRIAVASASSDRDRGSSNDPGLLVSYEQKVRPGEYTNRPYLELLDAENSGLRSMPERYAAVTPEWMVNALRLKELGIVNLTLLPPGQKRFRANVLAENATRVLVAYAPTPVTEQGRILQLIDKLTHAVVWSRTVDQLPQITRNGTYLSADPLPSGFYVTSDSSTPSVLLDNNGNIAHDFRPSKRD
ncbi:hypothetical protein AX767_04695 [Variovorax sp. PAMC 28711]|nr:hypothetical protein AX767_04695 [Variovorax sp. PAMC 28711]